MNFHLESGNKWSRVRVQAMVIGQYLFFRNSFTSCMNAFLQFGKRIKFAFKRSKKSECSMRHLIRHGQLRVHMCVRACLRVCVCACVLSCVSRFLNYDFLPNIFQRPQKGTILCCPKVEMNKAQYSKYKNEIIFKINPKI